MEIRREYSLAYVEVLNILKKRNRWKWDILYVQKNPGDRKCINLEA